MKIVGLTSVSGPYICARWSAFASKTSEHVFLVEFGRVSKTYNWLPLEADFPYKRVVLSEQPAETQSSFKLIFLLIKELSQVKPDVLVINGYDQLATILALVWCIWYKKIAILVSATKEDDAVRSWWRETFKQWIIKAYKAALVGGQPQKRYLTKLGMLPEKVFLGYNVVGNDTFHPDKIKHLPRPVSKPYFLAINRFVPKKNLLSLITSYAAYRKVAVSKAWDLVICGDGQLRPEMERTIAELALKDAVHLPGFLQQEEMLPYFAHANYFIHASIQEQWGLVVNEAMAAGLPVLVSNRCGCYEDLIIEGINGFGFDPENSQQLTNLMLKMSSGEIHLQEMGEAALEHIQKFSPDYFAKGLMQAVEYALAN